MKKRKEIQNQIRVVYFLVILFLIGIFGILQGKEENQETAIQENINDFTFSEEQLESEDLLKVYFLDVGQADSILMIQQKEAILIDAGNNKDGEKVVKLIQEKGIEKLNYVIGTHPHEDHIGGLDDVIREIDCEKIYLPKIQANTKTYEDVLKAIQEKDKKINSFQKGETFLIGQSKVEIMTDSILEKNNLNLASNIIRLEYGEISFLFTGDAEVKNENTRTWPQTNILKVGHHGSTTSTSSQFLEQIKPQYSIISVGKDNDYGHPKEKVLERLKKKKSQVYRTDENGTITILTDGKNIQILFEKSRENLE